MANIILKDKNGADVVYRNIDYVNFQTLEGGTAKFNEGDIYIISVEELPTENIKEDAVYRVKTTEDGNVKVAFYTYVNGEWIESGIGGDGTVIDVEELPTENIEQDKIYRVGGGVNDVTEIYIVMSEDDLDWHGLTNPVNLVDLDKASPNPNPDTTVVNIHIVDSLPEVGEYYFSYTDTGEKRTAYYIIANDPTSEAYYYDITNEWLPLSDFGRPYNGTVTDLADVTEEGYYIVKRQVSEDTIYGIPDEFNNKTAFKYTTEGGWKELGVGGGDGAIIDVTELPIENIEQDKIYKVTGEASAEIYLKFPNSPIMTLAEFFQSVPDEFPPIDNCITHLIESPEDFNFDTIIPYGESGSDLHVYVDTESGSAYADLGNGVEDVMYEIICVPSELYFGIISDSNDLADSQGGFGYVIVPPLSGYGIPDESNDKDIFKYSSEIGWEKLGVASERKEIIEVYITDDNGNCVTFAEYLQNTVSQFFNYDALPIDITYELVEEVPSWDEVALEDYYQGGTYCKCFILRETGEPYFGIYAEGLWYMLDSIPEVFRKTFQINTPPYSGFVSSLTEIEQKTEAGIFTLLKVVEGSNIVIDVDKLPMASVSNDKIYRVVQKNPEVWVVLDPWVADYGIGCSNPISLVDMIKAENSSYETTVNIHFVEQLPNVGEPESVINTDANTIVYNYYFSTSNSNNPLFAYQGDQWTNSFWWGNYRGTRDSISNNDELGYYILKNKTKTNTIYGIPSDCCIQVYKDGAWTTIWGEPIPEIPDKEVENEEVE